MEGIHHVSLMVRELAPAQVFYTDVLGMRPIDRPDLGVPGAWLEVADGRQVHLIEDPTFQPPDGPHFALRVRDLDATIAQLRSRGTEVSDATEIPGAGRQAFLRDPTGNTVELNEPDS